MVTTSRILRFAASLLLLAAAGPWVVPARAQSAAHTSAVAPAGKIVFLRPVPDTAGSDVWIMDWDGTNQVQLTNDGVQNLQPALSPDGTKIIYGARYNNELTLWVMDVDGSDKTELTQILSDSQAVHWSPDGSQIAYANASQHFWEVWVAYPDGSAAVRLTTHDGAAAMPHWAPDMQQLVYEVESSTRSYDVYTTTVTGSSHQLITSAIGSGFSNHWPAWSPDGTEIATIHFPAGSLGPYDLWLMNADGTNGRVLVQDIEGPSENRLNWSADGNWLIFGKNNQIWRVHRDGTQAFPVATSDAWQPSASVTTFPPLTTVHLPHVSYTCGALYMDDFSNPGSGWPVGDTGNALLEYLGGEYRMLVRPTDWWSAAAPGFKVSNGVIVAEVRNHSSNYGTYGLIFGLSDNWSQFYSFEIDPDGFYVVYRFDAGYWTILTVNSSGYINTGTATNRLKVQRNGSEIRLYANGQLLNVLSDGAFTGLRRVGLIVSTFAENNVDARFDNFGVYPTSCVSVAAGAEATEWQAGSGTWAASAASGRPDASHPRVPLSELANP